MQAILTKNYHVALDHGRTPAGILFGEAGRPIVDHLLETFNDDGSLEVILTDDPPPQSPAPFGAFSLRGEAQKKVLGDLQDLENHFRCEQDCGHNSDANQVRINICAHMRQVLIALFRE